MFLIHRFEYQNLRIQGFPYQPIHAYLTILNITPESYNK